MTLEKNTYDEVERVCREIVAPLVEADGGEMYLVGVTADEVHVFLSGTCSGCPGSTLTRERMIEPVVHTVAPKLKVRVSTGWRAPEGVRKL